MLRGRIPDFKHILSWSVFLLWAGIFAVYYFTGDFITYLNPDLGWLVALACLLSLIFFLAVFLAPAGLQNHSCACHEHHNHTSVDAFRLLILMAPFLFILAVQENSLGQYAFKKRSLNVARIDKTSKDKSLLRQTAEVDAESSLKAGKSESLVSLIDIHADFEKLLSSRIKTRGMFMSESPGLPEGCFVIYRFVITCCIADAQPLAVMVKGRPPEGVKNEDWLEIDGHLTEIELGGYPAALIEASATGKTAKPTNPYLVPRMP